MYRRCCSCSPIVVRREWLVSGSEAVPIEADPAENRLQIGTPTLRLGHVAIVPDLQVHKQSGRLAGRVVVAEL